MAEDNTEKRKDWPMSYARACMTGNGHLIGVRAIAYFLRIRMEKVKKYEELGAPIYRDDGNRMRADREELAAWVKKRAWDKKPVK